MLTKPFVFVVQVVVTIFGTEVPTPTHAPTSVTSATSGLPTAIRSDVPPSNFSALGQAAAHLGGMLTKPSVFVVQVRGN
ncbi:hypothetical protein MRX96_000788 [Rhipicephalus microplus]